MSPFEGVHLSVHPPLKAELDELLSCWDRLYALRLPNSGFSLTFLSWFYRLPSFHRFSSTLIQKEPCTCTCPLEGRAVRLYLIQVDDFTYFSGLVVCSNPKFFADSFQDNLALTMLRGSGLTLEVELEPSQRRKVLMSIQKVSWTPPFEGTRISLYSPSNPVQCEKGLLLHLLEGHMTPEVSRWSADGFLNASQSRYTEISVPASSDNRLLSVSPRAGFVNVRKAYNGSPYSIFWSESNLLNFSILYKVNYLYIILF
jgi:hypothetical protein